MKGKKKRIFVRALLVLLLAPLWLTVLLAALLYLPPVQRWAVDVACEVAREQTGIDVSVGAVRLTPLLDIDLQRVVARERRDTLLDVRHFVVDLTLRRLLKGEVDVEAINLVGGRVDTRDLIASLHLAGRIGQCSLTGTAGFDPMRGQVSRLYLSDSDVAIAMRDTTIIDTTTSEPLPLTLQLTDVCLRRTHVAFHSRRDTLGLDARVGLARLRDADLDIATNHFRLGKLTVDDTQAELAMPYDGLALTARIGSMSTHKADIDAGLGLYTLPSLTVSGTQAHFAQGPTRLEARLRALDLDALRADVEHNTYDLAALALDSARLLLTGPMRLEADLMSGKLSTLRANLNNNVYRLDDLKVDAPLLATSIPSPINGRPLRVTRAKARLSDLAADLTLGRVDARLHSLTLHEACGFTLTDLTARLHYNAERLRLTDFRLLTPTSRLRGHADVRLTAQYPFQAYLEADLSRRDILTLAGPYLPPEIASHYPDLNVTLGLDAYGTLTNAHVRRAYLSVPRMLEATAANAYYNKERAGLQLDIATHDLSLVHHLLGLPADIDLPPMQFHGAARMVGQTLGATGTLHTGRGQAHIDADYNPQTTAARLAVALRQFPLRAFVTSQPIAPVTARLEASGRIDRRDLRASLRTGSLRYSVYDLSGLGADARLRGDALSARAFCRSSILDFDASASGTLRHALLGLDLRHIDLRALGLVDYPLEASLRSHIDGGTNLSDTHWAEGTIDSLDLTYRDTTYRDASLEFAFRTGTASGKGQRMERGFNTRDCLETLPTKDTCDSSVFRQSRVLNPRSMRCPLPEADAVRLTTARLATGDLSLTLTAYGGYEQIVSQCQRTAERLGQQLKHYELRADELRETLPTVSAHIESGRENVIYRYLEGQGIAFRDLYLDLEANPETGLNAEGKVHDFQKDSVRISDIALHIAQDTTGLAYDAHALSAAFQASIKGSIATDGTSGMINVVDGEGKTWFNIGLKGDIDSLSKRLTIIPHNPILAYRRFKVNADNYLYMGTDNRVRADIDLLADDGTGLKLYSTPDADSLTLQDLTLAVNHFNVGELCSVIPGAPRAEGFLSGDVHMTKTAPPTPQRGEGISAEGPLSGNALPPLGGRGGFSFMCDLTVADMAFEGTRMGDIGVNAIYLPNADGSQYVNGLLRRGELDIAEVEGTYYPAPPTPQGGEGVSAEGPQEDMPSPPWGVGGASIDVRARLLDLPASLADAFTGGLLSLTGTLGGELAVTGSLAEPHINGALTTRQVHVLAPEYSVDFRLQDDTLRVAESQLHLDRLEAYSTGPTPLVLDGSIDFRDFTRLRLALDAEAHNFRLLDAPRSRQAAAYGRAYVDLGARLTGGLDHIDVRARLDVLSGTDLSYVLKDSPLAATNELDELVTFVNFADTTATLSEASSPPLDLNMTVAIGINDAAQVHCYLSDDRTNYVNVTGGGDLTMTYDPRNALQLSGRYTIHEGDIKYSMLVVPLKNFSITNGSYVEFLGPVADPHLNVAAKERLTTTITENQSPRSVAFDVGLSLTGTLEKMGLTFTIEAPEDMSIQNELAQMSDEQRGRVAVTMLATGMYINEASSQTSGGFSASNALNAFLQSQISNLSSKALGSVDLSVGMENGTTSTGSTTTDYSFRFAKRFWNNRISVIIGGKVSTGAEAENTGQTIINNVSLEYRLDNSATRYVKLFYDREAASLLEGEVTEMGAGIVLRRKTERLGELFMFRKKK